MEIYWIMGALFIVVTFVFVVVAVLFPEWVGIQGKVAQEFERQQRGEAPPDEGKGQ